MQDAVDRRNADAEALGDVVAGEGALAGVEHLQDGEAALQGGDHVVGVAAEFFA
ncbi:hypothetical protein D3C81_2074340 [compost metagenome]